MNSAVTTDTDLQCHRFMLADDKHSIEGIFYDIVSISPQYDTVVVIAVNVFHRSFSLNIVGSTDASGCARTAVQVRFKSHYFHVPRYFTKHFSCPVQLITIVQLKPCSHITKFSLIFKYRSGIQFSSLSMNKGQNGDKPIQPVTIDTVLN